MSDDQEGRSLPPLVLPKDGQYPMAPKVKAAAAAGAGGELLTGAVLWVLDHFVVTPGVDGDLPGWLVTGVPTAVGFVAALVAGWLARHQYRGGAWT